MLIFWGKFVLTYPILSNLSLCERVDFMVVIGALFFLFLLDLDTTLILDLGIVRLFYSFRVIKLKGYP